MGAVMAPEWQELTAAVHTGITSLDCTTVMVRVYEDYDADLGQHGHKVAEFRIPYAKVGAADGLMVVFHDRLADELYRFVPVGVLPLGAVRDALADYGYWDMGNTDILPVAFECEPVELRFVDVAA